MALSSGRLTVNIQVLLLFLAPTHQTKPQLAPTLLIKKYLCKHSLGDAFSRASLFFYTNSAIFCSCIPSNTCHVFSSYPDLMAASYCPWLCPPSSVSVYGRITHLPLSASSIGVFERNGTLLSAHCRPRRFLVRWLKEQSCLATLAAAGCYFSWLWKRFQSGVDIQRKSGVVRCSIMMSCPPLYKGMMIHLAIFPPTPDATAFLFFIWSGITRH